MIKAIVFDLDDTLIKEKDYIKSGFNHISNLISEKYGLKQEEIYSNMLELFDVSPKYVYNRLFELYNIKYTNHEIDFYIREYRNHHPNISLTSSTISLLENLRKKGYKIGIITDGYKQSQRNKINSLDLNELVDEIIVTDELGKEYWKPHPKAFEIMRERLDVKFDEMIYVGDNPGKDFYIGDIYPIITVRLYNNGVYQYSKYYRNIKEHHSIHDILEVTHILYNYKIGKKILFVATKDGFHKAFHLNLFEKLSKEGWLIDVASNGSQKFDYVDNKYNLNLNRNPLSFKNIKTIKELGKLIEKNNYDIVHSHTPIGGVIARLANKNSNTKSVYTAHGFHFYKGAPLHNWLFYYTVEKYLSRKTDLILTINQEDYNRALRKFKNPKIIHVNGVGINFSRFNPKNDTSYIRKDLGITKEDFIITSVGELNNNKNQMFAIKNLKKIIKSHNNVKYLIVGIGPNKGKYKKIIEKNNLSSNIFMLGFRTDIPELLKETDLFISLSKREGLPINILEAMNSRKIILASGIRGHVDLIKEGQTGYLFHNNIEFTDKVQYIFDNKNSLNKVREEANKQSGKYDVNNINDEMIKIYQDVSKK